MYTTWTPIPFLLISVCIAHVTSWHPLTVLTVSSIIAGTLGLGTAIFCYRIAYRIARQWAPPPDSPRSWR
ncbi:hypothetical protein HYV74_01890 [Candidatus Uhrbacteria bacterium]|nr:hypothetical protein [Candidatus Uhrbacteria bacterium]